MADKIEIIRLQANSKPGGYSPAAVAIGNFDGLHLGHQAVLETMRNYAHTHALTPSVLSFYPHPRYYFRPDIAPFLLQDYKSRFAALRDFGVKRLYLAHFNVALAQMSAEAFCENMLFAACNAKAVFTGENFMFGAARSGNIASLQAFANQHQIYTQALKGVMVDGHVCASTLIRHALERGDMPTASHMLGRHYIIAGRVQKGDGRGHQIGFATANIYPRNYQMVPAYGVYAIIARDQSGAVYQGVANLGVRPTFGGDPRPRLEAHLFDIEQDFLGKILEVSLLAFIRPEMKFDGIATLTQQIREDCQIARQILAQL